MLRLRDILAILAALVLTRMAYNDPSDSIAATVHLSFYVGVDDPGGVSSSATTGISDKTKQKKDGRGGDRLSLPPTVFDVDGDGAGEALVAVVHKPKGNGDSGDNNNEVNTYQIKVLDLKPAAFTSDKTHIAPFQPKTLYESEPFEFAATADAHPSGIATGQVLLKKRPHGRQSSSSSSSSNKPHTMYEYKGTVLNDHNRKYFCGQDWHEAANQCSHPCPSGQPSECPEGMRCFADTPCNIETYKQESEEEQAIGNLLVTPAGGLPSIFVLWTNGEVTMHSLTGDDPNANGTATTSRSRRRAAADHRLLNLREMWRTSVFSQFHDNNNSNNTMFHQMVDETINFIDSTDAGHDHGIVVVQAYVLYRSKEGHHRVTMPIIALDAKTGKILWDASIWDDKEEEEEAFPLPMQHGTASSARRRSMIPDLDHRKGKSMVPNCMQAYRRSMLTANDGDGDGVLPFLYWVAGDSTVSAVHFDHQLHHKKGRARTEKLAPHKKQLAPGSAAVGSGSSTGGGAKAGTGTQVALGRYADKIGFLKNVLVPGARKRHRHYKRHSLKLGRPNVVVSKIYNGLQVRSLRNGEALCHMTLWEETLFADINRDGILDTVQLLTGDYSHDEKLSEEEKWIARLVRRVSGMSEESANEETKTARDAKSFTQLCHVLALSGVPTKEELFSVNICGANFFQDNPNVNVEAAPPMVVEASRGSKGHDVVVAVSVGKVLRIRNTGRRQWLTQGKYTPDFPTWDDDSKVLLSRIDAPNVVVPASRPIVLAGENSLAILSAANGNVLSTAAFPQPTIGRPILADFNGDGTADVMVMTADAVWGYHVSVHSGSSVLFRIAVGLLLMGMMLAVLRNRFGPHPVGKRSTDA